MQLIFIAMFWFLKSDMMPNSPIRLLVPLVSEDDYTNLGSIEKLIKNKRIAGFKKLMLPDMLPNKIQ